MDKARIKEIAKTIMIIIGIIIVIYILLGREEKTGAIQRYELTEEEQLKLDVEELKEQNDRYQDEISQQQSQLEELQKDYENAEERIELLEEQLESYGIEPYEL